MKYLFLILLLAGSLKGTAQAPDTSYLKSLYDRCLDFSEGQLDSLLYYSNYIESNSRKSGFEKGEVLYLRLKGIYYDLKNDYEKALDYYLQSLTAAQKINGTEYEIAAYTDLAILYCNIKQPRKAKEMYLESAKLSLKRGYINSLITAYGNLGAIYNQLKLPDSALHFLNEGLVIGKPLAGEVDLSVIYNNLGNVYFSKKQYTRSLEYFTINKNYHSLVDTPASLWFDYLNIADVYIELKRYDSAQWYGEKALSMAKLLNSKSKESDSYALLAKLHARKGEYKAAYNFQKNWYQLDTSLVNNARNTTIADLQERYNAQNRQRENDILMLELEKQKLYRSAILYLLAGLLIIALLVAFSLIQKWKAHKKLQCVNRLIIRQNEKLTELNFEKNALIGVVSHDLATPFASIKMWSQILISQDVHLNMEQQKAISRIIDSTKKGEEMIKSILDVERADINQQPVCLEELNLTLLVSGIIDDFRPSANKKGVNLYYDVPSAHIILVSDEQLVIRVCQNLISNAIKFTPSGKSIMVSITEEKDNINIYIADEGVGIDCDELPKLFSKYSQLSSRPTNGEISNGLGLSIVKRILQELNGTVSCKSEVGKGSLFTVGLKK